MKDNLEILLYHGVTKVKSKGIENCSKKHIDYNIFEKQIKKIKKTYRALSIDEVVYKITNKEKFSSKSVVVSFDDGYKNNYQNACPILEYYKVPAVFYISAGMINKKNIFWTDIIEACINNTLNKSLKIYLDKKYIFDISSKLKKISIYLYIKRYCKIINIDQRKKIIKSLIIESNIKPDNSFASNYQILNWRELRQIHKNPLFTIGGHNLYHDSFCNIEKNNIKNEIKNTIHLLQKNLNSKIIHYSYPEGQKYDFNNFVIKEIKNQGIICCPSAISGRNSSKSDLFSLKRKMVGFENKKFPL